MMETNYFYEEDDFWNYDDEDYDEYYIQTDNEEVIYFGKEETR